MAFPARLLSAATMILILASVAGAETLYVSDTLVITVRDSKSNNYNVLETVQTDTPIEVLDQDKTFVRGKTPKGTVGFILKQYLTKDTPKSTLIKRLENQVAALQQDLDKQKAIYQQDLGTTGEYKDQVASLTTELSETRQQLETTKQALDDLTQRSEHVLEVAEQNEQLIANNELISRELEVLRAENQDFHRSNMIQWFIAGAAVFFGGWLIGKISRKKTRGYSRM